MNLRLTLFATIVLLSSFLGYSQSITIPDAGFVNFLQYTYPSCMNGNLLDTTCSEIVNETKLEIPSSYNLQNAEGVQYFDNLDTLNLNYHSITTIPPLPMDLQYLSVAYCELNSIPNYPSSLIFLDISGNNGLSSVPSVLPPNLVDYFRSSTPNLGVETVLPATLETYYIANSNVVDVAPLPAGLLKLSLNGNYFVNMPTFPNGLDILGIKNTSSTSLPAIPNSVTYLNAGGNPFTTLDAFPPNLVRLYLNNCSDLTSIENIPSNLVYFQADNCDLNNLGYLPNSIANMTLANNNLTSIPNLPNSAFSINLEDNNLNYLPSIPTNLHTLKLSNNAISCLPHLPESILTITLENNNFTCLPNILPAMEAQVQSYPLCVEDDVLNNPYGCMAAKGVEGYTFKDENSNCFKDAPDVSLPNIPVKIYDEFGEFISTTSTFSNGRYYFDQEIGEYDVIINTVDKPYDGSCTFPGIDSSVTLTALTPLAQNVNFSLKCKDGFDVGTRTVGVSGIIFPGQPHTLSIKAGDMTNFYNLSCSDGVSGTVTVTIDGPVTFQNVTPGSLTPTIVGNTYTYNVADFGAVNPELDFRLDFETDTTAVADDQICVQVNVTPENGDNNLNNNNFETCFSVVNSYDPNNKLVYPTEISPDFSEYITYRINFQNTGNAPAFNIRLEDTLSEFLDLETIEVIDFSHEMHFKLIDRKLVVYFPNIMLVDSTTSEPDSKGYVTFKIKTSDNLAIGEVITNTAYIFFDFNAPIITNSVLTEVVEDDLSIGNEENKIQLGIYPNPSNGIFNLSFQSSPEQIRIFDQHGKLIDAKLNYSKQQLDLTNYKAGIYFINATINNTIVTNKLIKK